eukprot:NODE_2442_length_1580_cov_12.610158_g2100_i0.p1 GENE.NODE_2442_length_1580_cov_12.610158_g2100_i0~~NODE_2442_length_1580_cov_12.610158_g2100_i0.p1  ORF type:complete len:435 (+),score=112.22 NODE_2442_length_1580_cov_12.610158_g2100_i0:128-1432(+)
MSYRPSPPSTKKLHRVGSNNNEQPQPQNLVNVNNNDLTWTVKSDLNFKNSKHIPQKKAADEPKNQSDEPSPSSSSSGPPPRWAEDRARFWELVKQGEELINQRENEAQKYYEEIKRNEEEEQSSIQTGWNDYEANYPRRLNWMERADDLKGKSPSVPHRIWGRPSSRIDLATVRNKSPYATKVDSWIQQLPVPPTRHPKLKDVMSEKARVRRKQERLKLLSEPIHELSGTSPNAPWTQVLERDAVYWKCKPFHGHQLLQPNIISQKKLIEKHINDPKSFYPPNPNDESNDEIVRSTSLSSLITQGAPSPTISISNASDLQSHTMQLPLPTSPSGLQTIQSPISVTNGPTRAYSSSSPSPPLNRRIPHPPPKPKHTKSIFKPTAKQATEIIQRSWRCYSARMELRHLHTIAYTQAFATAVENELKICCNSDDNIE